MECSLIKVLETGTGQVQITEGMGKVPQIITDHLDLVGMEEAEVVQEEKVQINGVDNNHTLEIRDRDRDHHVLDPGLLVEEIEEESQSNATTVKDKVICPRTVLSLNGKETLTEDQ